MEIYRFATLISQPILSLTPSVIEGMRQKLGVSAILRHKFTYTGLSVQQEQTHPRGWIPEKKKQQLTRPRALLVRGVLLSTTLHLAFATEAEATTAATQHLCPCRNEDILLPGEPQTLSGTVFDLLPGFELRFAEGPTDGAFLVGYNRFAESAPMYGRLEITGNLTAKPVLEREARTAPPSPKAPSAVAYRSRCSTTRGR